MAAALLADAVAFHKAHGRTLADALDRIWQQTGYYMEGLHNVTLPGREGQAQIAAMMAALRQAPPAEIGAIGVAFMDDYATGTGVEVATGRQYKLPLERANVLHYRFHDGGFVMVRPSGTEPKLKLYFSVGGSSQAEAEQLLAGIRQDMLERMNLL